MTPVEIKAMHKKALALLMNREPKKNEKKVNNSKKGRIKKSVDFGGKALEIGFDKLDKSKSVVKQLKNSIHKDDIIVKTAGTIMILSPSQVWNKFETSLSQAGITSQYKLRQALSEGSIENDVVELKWGSKLTPSDYTDVEIKRTKNGGSLSFELPPRRAASIEPRGRGRARSGAKQRSKSSHASYDIDEDDETQKPDNKAKNRGKKIDYIANQHPKKNNAYLQITTKGEVIHTKPAKFKTLMTAIQAKDVSSKMKSDPIQTLKNGDIIVSINHMKKRDLKAKLEGFLDDINFEDEDENELQNNHVDQFQNEKAAEEDEGIVNPLRDEDNFILGKD